MTAIAAICRPGEIVIAADSRRLGVTTGEHTLVCKIRDLETLFAVVSGINTYDATDFDVSELIPTQMPDVDVGTNADSIRDAILPPLRCALEHLRSDNPDRFQSVALQKSPMNIKFARVQNSVPILINMNVAVQVPQSGPLVITPQREDWPILGLSDEPVSYFVGTDDGVAAYKALANSGGLYQGDLVQRARNFVQMEIDKLTPYHT